MNNLEMAERTAKAIRYIADTIPDYANLRQALIDLAAVDALNKLDEDSEDVIISSHGFTDFDSPTILN